MNSCEVGERAAAVVVELDIVVSNKRQEVFDWRGVDEWGSDCSVDGLREVIRSDHVSSLRMAVIQSKIIRKSSRSQYKGTTEMEKGTRGGQDQLFIPHTSSPEPLMPLPDRMTEELGMID